MDYDECMRILIEFISLHSIDVPITKIYNTNFPFRLLHKAFSRVNIKDGVLEVMITDDSIVVVHKSTFLKAIGFTENPKCFRVHKPTSEEFQSFLTQIGYNGDFKAKGLNRPSVLGLWTILMHFIFRVSQENIVVSTP